MDKCTIGTYVLTSIMMISAAKSAYSGDRYTNSYEISSDSTRVCVVHDGTDLFSPNDLLYNLPDSVYAVTYSKPYVLLPSPSTSDSKPWRKLAQLAAAPDGAYIAVVANDGAGSDVLLKRVTDGQIVLVGWGWHHAVVQSLYWSPDSRYLLVPRYTAGDQLWLSFLEVTPKATDPVTMAAEWKGERGWNLSEDPPMWDMSTSAVTISLQGPSSGMRTVKVIHFDRTTADSTEGQLNR
jgi:hypothetical protein